ncbi:MAG: YjhX family toxin [Devosia sp.]
MDISRLEQRVLHVLAQGGCIAPLKDYRGRIGSLELYNRDGWQLPIIDPMLFKKLKRRKMIASSEGGPYRITRRGLELVRSEYDNR